MNLKCLFFHAYEEIGRAAARIYENSASNLPCRTETTFLFKCKKCGLLKTQTVKGLFVEDDDDDGGDGPEKKPLSPDDYYDLLNK